MTRVGRATPLQEELLRRGSPAGNDVGGDLVGMAVGDACGARDDSHHLSRKATEILPRLFRGDLVELAEHPLAGESRRLALKVGGRVPGQARRFVRIGIGHPRFEVVVDEEPPDVLVRVAADELLDVDPAVPQRAAFTVRLRDLCLDGDHTFETGLEVVASAAHWVPSRSSSVPTDRSCSAASTSAAAAASWTATPTDLYRVISSRECRPGLVPATSSPSSAWMRAASTPASSGAPAGGGASAEARDSTTRR